MVTALDIMKIWFIENNLINKGFDITGPETSDNLGLMWFESDLIGWIDNNNISFIDGMYRRFPKLYINLSLSSPDVFNRCIDILEEYNDKQRIGLKVPSWNKE